MGVSGLTPIAEEAKNPTSSMEEFRGKTIGYDLSCLLHKIVSTKQGSDELYAKPPMPFSSLAGIVDAEVKSSIHLE